MIARLSGILRPSLSSPCSNCAGQGCTHCKTTRSSSSSLPKKAGFTSLAPPTEEQCKELVRGMPELAGQSLQTPFFHCVPWLAGQTFAAVDDPDRTSELWQPPDFIHSRDPVLQRERTSTEEVHLPEGEASGPCSFARVVYGVMEQEDCAELIYRVNAKGYTPALINIGQGHQKLEPRTRDGHRVIVDCRELTKWLLEVLRPHLPEYLVNGEELLELNERCRFLCYTPGQEFKGHHDGCFQKPTGERSQVTVQLYLHDVPVENGGATTFLGKRHSPKPCQPVAGSVLLFTQDLYHEGSLLKSGLKYTFRTEAMYR